MLTHYYCLLAMWLGTFYHWGILILHPLLGDGYTLSSFQSSILVALSVIPAWLLANHDFIKPIQVTNLYKVQDYCTTAYYQHYEEGLSMGRIVRCMGFSSGMWLGGTGFSGWQGGGAAWRKVSHLLVRAWQRAGLNFLWIILRRATSLLSDEDETKSTII